MADIVTDGKGNYKVYVGEAWRDGDDFAYNKDADSAAVLVGGKWYTGPMPKAGKDPRAGMEDPGYNSPREVSTMDAMGELFKPAYKAAGETTCYQLTSP